MDGKRGNAQACREDNDVSNLEGKDARENDIIRYISLGDGHSIGHLLPMCEEDKAVSTEKKRSLPDVDDGASSEFMFNAFVVTEDGSVFPAEQSNIILGNDGTMCVTKQGIIYEIEKIFDYDTWNALISSQEHHQLISTVGDESADQDQNHIPVYEDRESGYSHPFERTGFSEDESVITENCSAAVVNRPTLQDSRQASGNALTLDEGTQQDSPHRTADPRKTHPCKVCGTSFPAPSALSIHTRTHTGEKPFQCKQCGKCFARKFHLVTHKRTHTGERPYQCTVCGKSFTRSASLSMHARTHTGEKPYICKVCSRSFSKRSNLVRHNIIHTGEKPHQCDTCGKYFAQPRNLTIHKQTHTHEKPYQCKVCGKCFCDSSNLSSHNLIHTGEKPFQCQTCRKSFRTSSNFSQHKRIHSNTKPHQCQQCGKSFRHKRNLSQHSKVHSNNNPAYE